MAKNGLDELMQKPVDRPDRAQLIQRKVLSGDYDFKGVVFKYTEDDPRPTLVIPQLKIHAGEKVAILGRNGAGKSSLLQLLSGMQLPVQGKISLDGVDQSLLDPDDIRRDMALLNQNAHLFFGTIRENLTLGAPLASNDEIIRALQITNALEIVEQKKRRSRSSYS